MSRILVISTGVKALQELIDILVARGHEAFGAIGGNNGLAVFRQCNPDLVVTALVMNDGDGIEVISTLRRETFAGPIIAISGGEPSRRSLYARLARVVGANETLAEPFSASELAEAIGRLLPRPGAAS